MSGKKSMLKASISLKKLSVVFILTAAWLRTTELTLSQSIQKKMIVTFVVMEKFAST